MLGFELVTEELQQADLQLHLMIERVQCDVKLSHKYVPVVLLIETTLQNCWASRTKLQIYHIPSSQR